MTPIPTFPIFRRLELGDRQAIEAITQDFPPYSDFEFTGLWAWDTDETCAIAMLGDNLVFRLKDYTSDDHFYAFIGRDDVVETSATLLAHARQAGLLPRLGLIPEEVIAADDRLPRYFAVTEDRDNFDYLYAVADWAHFPGSRFRKHRTMLRRCRAHGELELQFLDPANPASQEAINDLFRRWEQQKQPCMVEDHRHEWTALQRLYSLANDERLTASGCFHRDRLVGFSIWEQLPGSEYAIGHFQKADRTYTGLSSWQAHTSGQHLLNEGYRVINCEQDLGVEGLRAFKLSLQPSSVLRKYVIAERCTARGQDR